MQKPDICYRKVGLDYEYTLPHEHLNTLEIIQTLDDRGNIVIKNKVYPMEKGALYVIDGLCVHGPAPLDRKKYCRNIITLQREYLIQILSELGLSRIISALFLKNGGTFCPLGEHDAEKIDTIFKNILRLRENTEDDFAEIKILMCVSEILETAAKNQRTAPVFVCETTDAVLEYIEENLADELSLDTLAEKLHISKYYLCHLFKKQTGFTISGFITARRLSLAKSLLINTDKPILQISSECGVSSQSYFGKLFLKHEGITPSEYRNRYKVS